MHKLNNSELIFNHRLIRNDDIMTTNNDDGMIFINEIDRTSEITNYLNTKLDTAPFLNWMSWTFNPGGEGNFVDAMKEITAELDRISISNTFKKVIGDYAAANKVSIGTSEYTLYEEAELILDSANNINKTSAALVRDNMIIKMDELKKKIKTLPDSNDKTNLKLIYSRIDAIYNLELEEAPVYRNEFSTNSTISNLYNSLPDLSWLRKAIGSLLSSATQTQATTSGRFFLFYGGADRAAITLTTLLSSQTKYEKAFDDKNELEKGSPTSDICSQVVLADKMITGRSYFLFCEQQESFIKKGYKCEQIEGQAYIECKDSAEDSMHSLVRHLNEIEQYITNKSALQKIKKALSEIKMPTNPLESIESIKSNIPHLKTISLNIDKLGYEALSKEYFSYNVPTHQTRIATKTTIQQKLESLKKANLSPEIMFNQSNGKCQAIQFRDNHWDDDTKEFANLDSTQTTDSTFRL